MSRTTKTVVVLIGLAGFAWVTASLLSEREAAPRTPPPNPNGYDDFLKAAKEIARTPRDYAALTKEELKVLVATNAEPLRLIRLGMDRECQVPFDHIVDRMIAPGGTMHMASLKNLFILLLVEAKLAELEGRTNDALKSYLYLLRFSEAMARAGVVIDKLMGFAGTRLTLTEVNRLKPTLSNDQCRVAIEALQDVRSQREPFENVWKRDQAAGREMMRRWDRQWLGIRAFFSRVFASRQTRDIKRMMQVTFNRANAELDLMVLELSLRRYLLETGKYPDTLAGLSRNHLKALPRDPFSTNGFVYRVEGSGYLLYSIGPDGKDDHGKPLSRREDKNMLEGDLVWRTNADSDKHK